MSFIKPMLASPLKAGFIINPGEFCAEEKIDGIRIIAEVGDGSSNLFLDKFVTPWSRYEKIHPLPSHVIEGLSKLPHGIYDGEIYIPGTRSYGATELVNLPDMIYCIFDILQIGGLNATPFTYRERRKVLEQIQVGSYFSNSIHLISSRSIETWDEMIAIRDEVWERDGEGLILKRMDAPYQVGKRSKDFIKIKKLQSALLTVIGFKPSRGELNDRGPYATVVLKDDEENTTTVKTRNDAACREFEKEALTTKHPSIGRRLWIEYQERTPDGNYRHPRWDRWEDD